MNVRDLATPKPGYYVAWYNYLAASDTFRDRNGKAVNTLPIGSPPVNVAAEAQVVSSALSLMWARDLGGGLRYLGFVVPSFVWGNGSIYFDIGGRGRRFDGSVNGFGDLAIAPAYLSYGTDVFDVTGGYTVYAPTGKYTPGGDDNVGLGYWTNRFQAAGYLYFLQKALALMVTLTYEVPTKILGADVRPGQRFTIDYGVSQYVTDWLELGAFGAQNFQVTRDFGDDVTWDRSVKDRKSVAGAFLGVWMTRWLELTMRGGADYAVRQRLQNVVFQLNATFILGSPAAEENG